MDASLFGTLPVWKILLRVAPPVMLAQLIQALYNVVDSFFVGRYSGDGLTALSVSYPIQLVITALAVGTGVGVNTQMSRLYAKGREEAANKTGGAGILLALVMWALFTAVILPVLRPFSAASAESAAAVEDAVVYGTICCAGSVGVFLEGIFSKIHQARGNMVLPMVARCGCARVRRAGRGGRITIFRTGARRPFRFIFRSATRYASKLFHFALIFFLGYGILSEKGIVRACAVPNYVRQGGRRQL